MNKLYKMLRTEYDEITPEPTDYYIVKDEYKLYYGDDLLTREFSKNGPDYLKFTSLADGSTIALESLSSTQTLEYAFDAASEVWTSFDDSSEAITLDEGEFVFFRGEGFSNEGWSDYTNFSITGEVEVSGDITTICNLVGNLDEIPDYGLQNLFSGSEGLISAENLLLPSDKVGPGGYHSTFGDCTNLLSAPKILPATVLATDGWEGSYYMMFYGCTALVDVPILKATIMVKYGYAEMFEDCTSLVSAPILPATALAENCYECMFRGCSSLIDAPELPAIQLAESCYYNMFQDCTSLVTAPELPATTLAEYCYQYMFKDCTSLTQAPELPATTLASGCYSNMFQDCTSLTQAPELPATTLAEYCYQYMFGGCTSLTQAPELPATTLAENCYNSMFYRCSSLNAITVGFEDWTALPSYATSYWLSDVSETGDFYGPDPGSTRTGSTVPSGWTIHSN